MNGAAGISMGQRFLTHVAGLNVKNNTYYHFLEPTSSFRLLSYCTCNLYSFLYLVLARPVAARIHIVHLQYVRPIDPNSMPLADLAHHAGTTVLRRYLDALSASFH